MKFIMQNQTLALIKLEIAIKKKKIQPSVYFIPPVFGPGP